MIIYKEKSKYLGKRVFQQTRCLSPIPHGLPWKRIRATAFTLCAPAGTLVPTVTQWSTASCAFVTTGLPTLCHASIVAETSTNLTYVAVVVTQPLDGREVQSVFGNCNVLNAGPVAVIVNVCPRTYINTYKCTFHGSNFANMTGCGTSSEHMQHTELPMAETLLQRT